MYITNFVCLGSSAPLVQLQRELPGHFSSFLRRNGITSAAGEPLRISFNGNRFTPECRRDRSALVYGAARSFWRLTIPTGSQHVYLQPDGTWQHSGRTLEYCAGTYEDSAFAFTCSDGDELHCEVLEVHDGRLHIAERWVRVTSAVEEPSINAVERDRALTEKPFACDIHWITGGPVNVSLETPGVNVSVSNGLIVTSPFTYVGNDERKYYGARAIGIVLRDYEGTAVPAGRVGYLRDKKLGYELLVIDPSPNAPSPLQYGIKSCFMEWARYSVNGDYLAVDLSPGKPYQKSQWRLVFDRDYYVSRKELARTPAFYDRRCIRRAPVFYGNFEFK